MVMKEKVSLTIEIDVDSIRRAIKDSAKLEDQPLFKALSQISDAEEAVKAVLAEVDQVKKDARALIDQRARKVIGENWKAIKGEGFKITKVAQGASYLVDEDQVDKSVVKIEVKPDSKKIDAYEKENGELPKGVQVNPERGFRIDIKGDK